MTLQTTIDALIQAREAGTPPDTPVVLLDDGPRLGHVSATATSVTLHARPSYGWRWWDGVVLRTALTGTGRMDSSVVGSIRKTDGGYEANPLSGERLGVTANVRSALALFQAADRDAEGDADDDAGDDAGQDGVYNPSGGSLAAYETFVTSIATLTAQGEPDPADKDEQGHNASPVPYVMSSGDAAATLTGLIHEARRLLGATPTPPPA